MELLAMRHATTIREPEGSTLMMQQFPKEGCLLCLLLDEQALCVILSPDDISGLLRLVNDYLAAQDGFTIESWGVLCSNSAGSVGARATNRGEPFRQGIDLFIDTHDECDNFDSIFIQEGAPLRTLSKVLTKMLADVQLARSH
jgi:hypothetical protein